MGRGAVATGPVVVQVGQATHDGRGIGHVDGKVIFIDGALPGEVVEFVTRRRRRRHDEGSLVQVIEPSSRRMEPACSHFGTCGGCVLQHAEPSLQLEIKQRALADSLERIGRVRPARWLDPVTGPIWGYRRRARLSVRYVEKKGRVLVGFREKGRALVADLTRCPILAPPVDGLIAPLAKCIDGLDSRRAVPQVEVAVADEAAVFVLRHLEPLGERDVARLRAFEATHDVRLYLQGGGYETLVPLSEPDTDLRYRLPEHDTDIHFAPNDFVQVNAVVNRALVTRAIELLAPAPGERFADLFCGLGNFSLPLARRSGHVVGVEGDAALVRRAVLNAGRNGIANVEFHVGDLFEPDPGATWAAGPFDGVLIDPPRAGAREALQLVAQWVPRRVVYVSCHPGTLARDAGTLVHEHGYRLAAAGIADMFPHTSHVESVALFER